MGAEDSADIMTPEVLKIVSIAFGWSVGFGFLVSVKAVRQTLAIWKRTHDWRNLYVIFVWVELLSNWAMAIEFYLVINGAIPNNFAFCFTIVSFWAIEVQCLAQIILNRISLISLNKRRIFRLKLIVFFLILLINISVYCIWIPARLGISQRYMDLNQIWDRVEKVIYMLIDLSLNVYFLWLTRKKLIQNGLTKYKKLFNFNAAIVGVSMCMDVLVIGMMSVPNTYVYGQFHPIAYLVKLNIELTMADLISKLVMASPTSSAYPPIDLGPTNSAAPPVCSKYLPSNGSSSSSGAGSTDDASDSKSKLGNSVDIGDGSVDEQTMGRIRGREEADLEKEDGIVKDVETIVQSSVRKTFPVQPPTTVPGVEKSPV